MLIEDVDSLSHAEHIDENNKKTPKKKMLWLCITSVWLWFNLVSTPFLILWPDLDDKTQLWYIMWGNELVWILDMVRQFFDKPRKSKAADVYDIAVAYMKSYFIIDLVATVP